MSLKDSHDEYVARSLFDLYLNHFCGESFCHQSNSVIETHIEVCRRNRIPPVPKGITEGDVDNLRGFLEKRQEHEHHKLDALEEKRQVEMREKYIRRSELAERNASELIREEEEAKLKAQKKKAKKETQKKKKAETKPPNSKNKSNTKENNHSVLNNAVKKLNLYDDEEQVHELDKQSAFLSKAMEKVEKLSINNKPKSKNEEETKDLEPMVKKALDLINKQEYKESIQFLSEAINLAPTRVDLLLKRSWVYFQLTKYKKSLRDAERSLKIHPFNPEGFYRLGEAHLALNSYLEADAAFSKIVNNSTYKSEVKDKLFSLRIKQLVEMGYDSNESFTALLKSDNKTLDEAIDYLTNQQNGTAPPNDLYYSEEEDSEEESSEEEEIEGGENKENNEQAETNPSSNVFPRRITISKHSPLLVDPSNPFHCCTLFVGNMKEGITNKEIQDVFIKFGDISSIKLVSGPRVYAFVNYVEWQSAGQAMEALQGSRWLLSTMKSLTIKYPVNLVNIMIPLLNQDALLVKVREAREAKSGRYNRPKPFRPYPVNPSRPKATGAFPKPAFRPKPMRVFSAQNVKDMIDPEAPSQFPVVEHLSSGRPRPRPKTEECYFWRTTGCTFGKKCFNLHIPDHKGIALKERSAKFSKEN